MGRFSTTAKLDLLEHEELLTGGLFRWYEFELGEKKGGELLAVFELVEVDSVRFGICLKMKCSLSKKTT